MGRGRLGHRVIATKDERSLLSGIHQDHHGLPFTPPLNPPDLSKDHVVSLCIFLIQGVSGPLDSLPPIPARLGFFPKRKACKLHASIRHNLTSLGELPQQSKHFFRMAMRVLILLRS